MKQFAILFIGISLGLLACKKASSPGSTASGKNSSDQKISIAVDNSSAAVGTNVRFRIEMGNDGPDVSTGVVVNCALPSGYSFVSASPTTGDYTAGIWNGFSLAKGANASLTIIATVNAAGSYLFRVTVTGKENDPSTANNSATITISPAIQKVLMVSTIAGSERGHVDAVGIAAQFSTPRGLAVDASGNIYVADYSNNCIRKITAAGAVSTLAGSTNGFADGLGSAAKFSYPNSVATDAAGNVFVADAGNNRIRKITPGGAVTTLAGDGSLSIFYQPLGLVVDAAGNVYVADANNNRIVKINTAGGMSVLAGSADGGSGSAGYADGTGTNAKFSTPNGLVIDAAGNVFVTDASNYVVRKITPAGVVTTFAGSVEGYADGMGSDARFEHLTGPAIDAAGNIYVADIGNNSIRKITPAGLVSTMAGGPTISMGYADGPLTTAQFSNPYAIAVDIAGNIYVSDVDNNRIRKIGY